jgi:hypothetical protein
MNFPAGVIFIWTGSDSNIPTGWERVTSLNSMYPKGTANATVPNTTGGAATHEHVGTTHSHTMNGHSHTVYCGAAYGGYRGTSDSSENCINKGHTHGDSTSGGVINGSLSEVACTYSAVSNDPPYYTVLFITPTTGVDEFPQNAIYLYDSSDSKSGHYICDGNNSTPNLADKYLKGDNGTAAGDLGGSVTNVHILTHTHTSASHYHTYSIPASLTGGRKSKEPATTEILKGHAHSGNLNTSTTGISSTAPSLTTSETVEPAYRKLLTVQNKNTGGGSYRVGMIGMWLGYLEDIPAGYILCDGSNGTQDMRSKHLKSTATTSSIGNIGGSNTHTHASQDHTHTASGSHSHTQTLTHTAGRDRDGSVTYAWVDSIKDTQVYHDVSTSSVTSSYASAYTTGDSQPNEPSYRTVAFIKFFSLNSDKEENISVTTEAQLTQAYSIEVSETVTLSELDDENVRNGLSIHIWKEKVGVVDYPQMPGEKGLGNQFEDIHVTDDVTVKLSSEGDDSYKPYFMVGE